MTRSPRMPRRLFAALLLISALVRIALLCCVTDEAYLHNDGVEYRDIAKNLYEGYGFSVSGPRWYEVLPPDAPIRHTDLSRTPLLPFLGAALYALPGNWMFWSKLLSLTLSLLALWAVWRLASDIRGEWCGLAAAILFSVYPYGLYYTICWSTEMLFLLCNTLAILYFRRTTRPDARIGSALLTGLFLALAVLTRPTAILFTGFFLAVYALLALFHRISFARAARTGLALCAALFLILLPWMIRNYQVGGKFTPLSYYDGYVFWLSYSEIFHETYRTLDTPEYTEATQRAWNRFHTEKLNWFREHAVYGYLEQAEYWKKWGREQIAADPGRALNLLKERFLHYFRMCPNAVVLTPAKTAALRLYFIPLFVLAIAGFLLMRRSLDAWILLLPPLFGLAVSIPFLFVLRYRFPFFAPFVCVFAAYAIAVMKTRLTNQSVISPSK